MRNKSIVFIISIITGLLILSNYPIVSNVKFNRNHGSLFCHDDTYEGNNHIDHATRIDNGSYYDLECYDNDYYVIWVEAGFKITVEIAFSNNTGDLSLELFNRDKDLINSSYSSNDYEIVSYTPLVSQNIYFRVFYDVNPNLYNLTVLITADIIQEVIQVIRPNSSSIWNVSSTYEIIWDASSLISNVRIELYRGAYIVQTISSNTPNDGTYPWTLSSGLTSSDDYYILIKDIDNDPQVSSNYFTIYNPSIPKNYISLQTPNSSSVWRNNTIYEIKWKASSDFDYVDISLLGPSGQYITEGAENNGSFWWTVPNSIISGQYYILIKNNESTYPYHSGDYFRIINTGNSVKEIAVSNPISTSTWQTSNQYEIRWITSGDIENVTIYYDTPFITTQEIVSNIINDGFYLWDIPLSLESGIEYTIRIEDASDSNIYDYSEEFIIENNNDPKLIIQKPDGLSNWETDIFYNITWITLGNVENITLNLSNEYGKVCTIISEFTNLNYYEWNVSNSLIGGKKYTLNISDSSNTMIYDISDEFNILNTGKPLNTITLINPRITSQWYVGNTYEITWQSTGNFEYVTLELYDNAEGFIQKIVEDHQNNGSFKWKIPGSLNSRNDYYIAIYNNENCTPFDTSAYFEIFNDNSITVLNPTATSVWEKFKTYEIQWSSTGSITHVRILYEYWSGNIVEINSSTENDGSYFWTLPGSLVESNDYHIIIQESGYPNIEDISDAFEIIDLLPPSIAVLSPNASSIWEISRSYNILWTFTGLISNVEILLKHNSDIESINSSTPCDGSYIWTIPDTIVEGSNYQIIIREVGNPDINDTSDFFSIVKMGGAKSPQIPGYDITIVSLIIGSSSMIIIVMVRKKKHLKVDF
ncbi:MAG: Ser-Thr-rich GPI-anchored membrane family protein [Promethearchaeota archaeon]